MFGMSVSYGLLRIPKMPEVKEWRDRAKKEKERRAADGEEEEAGLVSWQDREVDVSCFLMGSDREILLRPRADIVDCAVG